MLSAMSATESFHKGSRTFSQLAVPHVPRTIPQLTYMQALFPSRTRRFLVTSPCDVQLRGRDIIGPQTRYAHRETCGTVTSGSRRQYRVPFGIQYSRSMNVCAFCGHDAAFSGGCLGPLLGPDAPEELTVKEYYVHRLCAEWSPEIHQTVEGTSAPWVHHQVRHLRVNANYSLLCTVLWLRLQQRFYRY